MHVVRDILAGIFTLVLAALELYLLVSTRAGAVDPRLNVSIAPRLLRLCLTTCVKTLNNGWTVILNLAAKDISIGRTAIVSALAVAALLHQQLAAGI